MKLVLPLLVSSSNSKFPATTKPISNSDYKEVNVYGNYRNYSYQLLKILMKWPCNGWRRWSAAESLQIRQTSCIEQSKILGINGNK